MLSFPGVFITRLGFFSMFLVSKSTISSASIFKLCFNAFPAVNMKVKDMWQIKFAEDNFADKIDDHFRPLQFYAKRKEMVSLIANGSNSWEGFV